MQIFIRVKALGKRRDVLEKRHFEIQSGIKELRELISYIVLKSVRDYNERQVDAPLFRFLTEKEFNEGEYIGKIGFSDKKNENYQNEEAAVKNALECFEDGIYKVLINEDEITDLGEIKINENDTVTFIRLVMLAGRRW